MNKKEIWNYKLPLSTDEDPPRQLILRKDGEYVAAYDPVSKIELRDKELVITGYLDYEYVWKLDEVDTLEIIKWDGTVMNDKDHEVLDTYKLK